MSFCFARHCITRPFFILIFHYYYYRHHHYTNACMYESVVVCMSACICVFFLLFLGCHSMTNKIIIQSLVLFGGI